MKVNVNLKSVIAQYACHAQACHVLIHYHQTQWQLNV